MISWTDTIQMSLFARQMRIILAKEGIARTIRFILIFILLAMASIVTTLTRILVRVIWIENWQTCRITFASMR
jgi:hypothetical protein